MRLTEGVMSTHELGVVVRTDASLAIGTGHVMRCLTLASALREQGAAVLFVCREHDGHLCDLIETRGFSVSRLPSPHLDTQGEHRSTSVVHLASSWEEDARQTQVAIDMLGLKPDWLIVDHYNIDEQWEGALRTSVDRIMVIDDLADRVHDCDLLLDQNLVAQMSARYVNRVPPTCAVLLGLKYALLQPIYGELHDRVSLRRGSIRRILVFMGGVDRDNLTGLMLSACLSLDRSDIDIDVVIPIGSSCVEAIRERASSHANVHLHRDLPTLAPLMAQADLAIGAAGTTMFISIMPPGQGPCLHSHNSTYETFIVLEGTIEYIIGDPIEHRVTMGKWDTLSCPPKVYRGFKNVGDTDAVQLTVITGLEEGRDDVSAPGSVIQDVETRFGDKVASAFRGIVTFDTVN